MKRLTLIIAILCAVLLRVSAQQDGAQMSIDTQDSTQVTVQQVM